MVNGLIHILLNALRSSISCDKCLNSALNFLISKFNSFIRFVCEADAHNCFGFEIQQTNVDEDDNAVEAGEFPNRVFFNKREPNCIDQVNKLTIGDHSVYPNNQKYNLLQKKIFLLVMSFFTARLRARHIFEELQANVFVLEIVVLIRLLKESVIMVVNI